MKTKYNKIDINISLQQLEVSFLYILSWFTTNILEYIQLGVNIKRRSIRRIDWDWVI